MRFLLIVLLLLAGCIPSVSPADTLERPSASPDGPPLSPSPTQLQFTSEPATAAPTGTPLGGATAATPTPPSTPPGLPEEAILILEPGPGSRLTHPVRVFGVAGPAAEGELAARILAADGSVLSVAPVQFQAEDAERRHFSVQLPAIIEEDEIPAFVQVYATSPRDGGIVHLASASVRIASYGAEQLRPVPSQLEAIAIFQPTSGAQINGGQVQVLGIGLASYEQTLLAEVLDQDGRVVGSQALIVDTSEPGKPGPFQVDVLYSTAATGPGRVVVRDPNPALDGDNHLSSVEVYLSP